MGLNDFANRETDDEQKEISHFMHRFILRPEYWATYTNPIKLRWRRVRANAGAAERVPNDKTGIYTLVVDPGVAAHPGTRYLMYLGKAQDQPLRSRFRQYLSEANQKKGRPLIKALFKKWPGHLWFYFAEVDDIASVIHALEEELIGAFVPPQNDVLPAVIRPAVKAAWRK